MADVSVTPKGSAPLVPNGNITAHLSSEQDEPQRRRRRRQTPVEFPGFEDELRDGTQLQNPSRRDRTRAAASQDSDEIVTASGTGSSARRVGSQLLDLERGPTLNLSGINEDIVALSNDDFHSVMGHEAAFGHTDIHSEEPEKVYVERKGRFYALSKRPSQRTASDSGESKADGSDNPKPPVYHIYTGYQLFRRLCLFAHGFLAGLALFHCLFIFTLSPPHQPDWLLFARVYLPHAIWLKTVYQILVALACVSCLCRIDLIGGIDAKLCTKSPESVVAVVLYFGAVALTHLCDISVIRLLTEWNVSPSGFSADLVEELARWKIMDAVRTGCVCAGWLALACNWKRDRMNSYLKTKFMPKKA